MGIPKTLFMSRGNKGPAWYRCALPALALGADWTCYVGEPPNADFVYGRIERGLTLADVTDYEVVVIQQPRGAGWLNAIRDWQRAGVVVLADVEDLDDVRVRQLNEGADLAGESGDGGAGEDLGAGGLDDDVAGKVLVAGEVDDAHAPVAQLPLQRIFARERRLETEEFRGKLRHSYKLLARQRHASARSASVGSIFRARRRGT